MYLHLGEEIVILNRDIIGIFDLDTATVSKDTRLFLKKSEQNLQVTTINTELPKSFVLSQDHIGTRVYLSQISSRTLKGRTEFLYETHF